MVDLHGLGRFLVVCLEIGRAKDSIKIHFGGSVLGVEGRVDLK